jgi:hypothetical protein
LEETEDEDNIEKIESELERIKNVRKGLVEREKKALAIMKKHESSEPKAEKKGRGRPKKVKAEEPPKEKKPRGRPKKVKAEEVKVVVEEKKARGRPKKVKAEDKGPTLKIEEVVIKVPPMPKKGKKTEEPPKEKAEIALSNLFKSANDPEYFKESTTKERKEMFEEIFGGKNEKYLYSIMKPHLKNAYNKWCKKNNKPCAED